MSKRPLPAPRQRLSQASRGSGSFHAGAPIPTLASISASMRRVPSQRYQTFPTAPPKTPLEVPSDPTLGSLSSPSSSSASDSASASDEPTPLPVRQLLLLAFLSLSEQTALNSISPYLPDMVASMPEVPKDEAGLYIGILASSFALAQLSTNFLWGYASDVIGRKPVLLMGTFALMCCFCLFGLCNKYWQVIVVHIAMGMLNGNAACVPTVLGEITDRSNQSKAFTYLPVIYSIGSITGPALGGVLVDKMGQDYPYLGPNILGAALLAVSVITVAIWFEETLDAPEVPRKPMWFQQLGSWIFSSKEEGLSRSNSWSARLSQARQPLLSDSSSTSSSSTEEENPTWRALLNRTTIIILSTYFIFQLSNISFNSLYPIFASTKPPTGRGLGPGKIGISLSLAGLATIIFQAFLYRPLKTRIGNVGTYRLSLLGIAISMVLMPWIGSADGTPLFGQGDPEAWLYVELGFILVLKNVCAVGGLSSVMLLITNSAPSHAHLGTLNGVAQTLSALGRGIGPFVSGALFTLSTRIQPKGEALAWCLFGGLALVGWVGSLLVQARNLESDDWVGDNEEEDGEA